MHSSRMRTVRCSGRLSCHARPYHACPPSLPHTLPTMHASLPCMLHPYHACHLPTHACPCHTCPLPCMLPPPILCAPLPCMAPTTHAPHHTHPLLHMPLPWIERTIHSCENITFPQLLLRTVISILYKYDLENHSCKISFSYIIGTVSQKPSIFNFEQWCFDTYVHIFFRGLSW